MSLNLVICSEVALRWANFEIRPEVRRRSCIHKERALFFLQLHVEIGNFSKFLEIKFGLGWHLETSC